MSAAAQCDECKEEFDPAATAKIASGDGGSVEVQMHCPHCGAAYFTYIEPVDFVRDRDHDKEVHV
jgi:RNase P subunit RPR2